MLPSLLGCSVSLKTPKYGEYRFNDVGSLGLFRGSLGLLHGFEQLPVTITRLKA